MRRVLALAAVVMGMLAVPGVASALPAGSLDPSFGGTGLLTPDVIAGADDDPSAVAVDTQGRSVAVYGCGCTGDINLVRFKSDGSLDPTFGTGGVALVADGSPTPYTAAGVAIQSDGRIVVAYWDGSGEWLVTRYKADGTPDASFASGTGTFVQSTGVGDLIAVALDGDRIVLAGADNGAPTKPAVLRLTADGVADSSFNGGNVETIDFGGQDDIASGVQAAPNHKLAVVGVTDDGAQVNAAVARLDEDGTPDSGFSTDGLTTVDFGDDWSFANGVVAGADGSVIFAGSVDDPVTHAPVVTVTKLKPDGDPDAGFATGGQQRTAFPSGGAQSLTLIAQADGALLVGGLHGPGASIPDGFIYRYTPAGVLDNAFSDDGRATLTTGDFATVEQVKSLALAPDGRVIALGDAQDLLGGTIKTLIARVLTSADNCPLVSNPDQADLDGDGLGDPCDDDVDGDGLSNAVETAIGSDPRGTDSDGDGKADGVDSCPTLAGSQANGCPVVPKTDPPPVVDRTSPKLGFTLAAAIKRATFFAKGLTFTIASNEPVKLTAQLIGTLKGVHVARTSDVILAQKTLPLGGGNRKITFKLGNAQKRLIAKTAKLRVRITAFDAAGNLTIVSRTIRVK